MLALCPFFQYPRGNALLQPATNNAEWLSNGLPDYGTTLLELYINIFIIVLNHTHTFETQFHSMKKKFTSLFCFAFSTTLTKSSTCLKEGDSNSGIGNWTCFKPSNNKDTFQSNVNHPLANNTGSIMNKREHVRGGEARIYTVWFKVPVWWGPHVKRGIPVWWGPYGGRRNRYLVRMGGGGGGHGWGSGWGWFGGSGRFLVNKFENIQVLVTCDLSCGQTDTTENITFP